MDEKVKECGKRMAEVLGVLAKNYVASLVANGLKPVFVDAVKECLEEAKAEAVWPNPRLLTLSVAK